MTLAMIQVAITVVLTLISASVSRPRWRGALLGASVSMVIQLFGVAAIRVILPNIVLYGESARPMNLFIFTILAFISSTAVLALYAFIIRGARIRIDHSRTSHSRWKPIVGTIAFIFCTAVCVITGVGAWWVYRNFGDLGADGLRFFMAGDAIGGTTTEQFTSIILTVFIPTVVVVAVLTASALAPISIDVTRTRRTLSKRTVQRLLRSFGCITAVMFLAFAPICLPIVGAIKSMTMVSTMVEDNYVEPTDAIMHFPQRPKNLVHIFMESIENSYYSKDEGGYLDESLMPELAQLTRENVSFSHTDQFGGPHQTNGATHSIAGIINTQTGVPLLGVSLSQQWSVAYTDLPNLGHILHEHGYQNSYMFGSYVSFFRMGEYFSKYADFQMFDSDTARERGLVPPDYKVWWGIEDDKLYEFAKDELTRLAGDEKPFYFLLENADTHNNDGYLSPNTTEFPSKFQYGNVIHYSQKQTVALVRWMQQQPWYKDTVIVITGDHRSKDVTFFEGWDSNYERTVVNIIINGDNPSPTPEVTHNRDFGMFDFFPTILSAMGVTIDGDRLGIGTNLYSGKPTLIERLGYETVSTNLGMRSKWYEQRLIPDLSGTQDQGGVGLTR